VRASDDTTTTEQRVRPPHAQAEAMLRGTPYESYVYGYPHKLAYRPIEPARRLGEVWAHEKKDALFLYAHVPFCEQRCGFCNLFTFARPKEEMMSRYLDTFTRQVKVMREAMGSVQFERAAIGGGTPTYLGGEGLEQLIHAMEVGFDVDLSRVPTSVEVSPMTATDEALAPLRRRAIDRISMGVQSFVDEEAKSVQRTQAQPEVRRAIEAIRRTETRTLNLDLMYGLPGQSDASFELSLRLALAHAPEELYLYPLYVRPFTGIGKLAKGDRERERQAWDEDRLRLYRLGRDLLLSEGYAQVSMRMFRKASSPSTASTYRCERDGMVGLGCGARSYTEQLHYATAYATETLGVRDILERWIGSTDEELGVATWGIALDVHEQKRRYALLALLSDEGLSLDAYAKRFDGGDALIDIPELLALTHPSLSPRVISREGNTLQLTREGLERADAIGPFLSSPAMHEAVRTASRR
jgi:oxygen-independent coproporphyrinogen-3 oxidase